MNKLIENIPQRWNISKLKYFSDIFGRIGFRGYTASDLVDEGEGAITLGPPNIENQKLNLSNKKYISWEKYYESPEIQISNGDILLVKTASVGKVALVENLKEPTTINPQLVVFKNIIINPKFFYYSMISDIFQYQVSKNLNGGVISTLSQENIQNYSIPIPPNKEQKQIANYLDKKTSKIDTAIAKNKELINLLEEKRTALINQVVTKGLNPEVPMKDSGIEWIGEIPEHWEVTLARRFCRIETGGTPKREVLNYWENGTVNWMTSGEVNQEYVNDTKNKITVEGLNNSNAHILPRNSIVMALSGQGQTKGRVAVLNVPTCCSQSVGAFICDNIHIYYKYLFYYLKSRYYDIRGLVGDNLRDGLSLSIIGDISILMPPYEEQIKISNELDKHTPKINQTIIKIKENIELLEEYKTSLIHHVVTGKIDVRGEEI